MGDRGCIVIHDGGDPSLWIYSHWHGESLRTLLAHALETPQAQARIGDGSYLTRIVFCQIIKQVDDLDGETGWGIATSECESEYDLIHLDVNTGEVRIGHGAPLKKEQFISIYTKDDS